MPKQCLNEAALRTLPAQFISSLSFGGAEMRDVLLATADNQVYPELGGTNLRAHSKVPGLALTT